MVITISDGKRVGKNFSNGQEYNEIPDAFYSGFNNGDDEYITIPNPLDGNYKIEVQGTDDGGEYGVLTSYISDNFATTTETTGITQPNQITELNTTFNNQNPENLQTERIITLDVLINDINGAYDLGWIRDKKTRDEFIKRVNAMIKIEKRIQILEEKDKNGKKVQKKIERLEKVIDKKLAKILLTNLKAYTKGKITEEAYNIIKADLEYLINN